MKRRDALKNTALIGGSAALSGTLLGLLQACQEIPRLDWQPRFLSIDHAQLVSSLVDAILPATDTPGGLDVKVDILIDLLFNKVYDEEGQKKLVAEMDQFNEKCKSKFGKVFHKLDADQKGAILQEEEVNSPKFTASIWNHPVGEQKPVGFYRSFKSLAIMGYFTSAEVGTTVLKYDPIPGEYLSCIPFSDVGKVWSL